MEEHYHSNILYLKDKKEQQLKKTEMKLTFFANLTVFIMILKIEKTHISFLQLT